MCDNFDVNDKFCERGDLIDSKIRKFFFKLRQKEVERDLRVTIRVVAGEVTDEQKIVIELTNDSNPVFLFLLYITKNDFEILRSDQGINVDYKDFPQALVNLLDKCAEAVSTNGGVFKLLLDDYCGISRGGCLMDMKKIKIKILEECAFKNMCHLTLEVLRGSEGQIQQKLEMELIKTKQGLLQESKLHDEALKNISELVEDINDRNKELENLNRVIDELKDQREVELKKERETSAIKEKQLREEYEGIIYQEREQFQKKLEDSQLKMRALEDEVIRINKKQLEMASQILERGKEIEGAKTELAVTKQEVSLLQNQNSRLDADYHDKEKAVNILRTRLAVAEQELKDNNILLLNHQKKVDETSKEKVDLQKNLEFIKSKLEKKESVVLNLSEELLKGNEIISKQQAKISLLTAKQKENEEFLLQKQKLVEEKENLLLNNCKKITALLEELDKEKKQVFIFSDKINSVEKNLKDKNEKLENALKVIAMMKENLQNRSSVLKSKPSERSLLFYRSFLSTPCLLPSDDSRRLSELNRVLKNELQNDDFINCNIKSSNNSAESKNITTAFIARYLKRFVFIPSSLFRSSNIPLTVLSSSNGVAVSRAMCNLSSPTSHGDSLCGSKNILGNTNEYLAYTMPDQYLPSNIMSVVDGELNSNYQSNVACCSSESDDLSDKIKDVCFQKGDYGSNYSPVGAFRLGPAIRNYNNSIERQSRRIMEGPGIKPPLRNTPAISAPPLTQKQKEGKGKESVLQDYRLHLRRTKGRNSSTASQNSNPLHVRISSSSDSILQKQLPYRTPGKHAVSAATAPNALIRIQEQPEPSAYFIS